MAEEIDATVVYVDALAREMLIAIKVAPGATLGEVIRASGVLEAHPEIVLEQNRIGVWGKVKKIDAMTRDGDRVEIYRGLLAEPNATRLARAAKKAADKDRRPNRPLPPAPRQSGGSDGQ